jgi:ABC-type transport system involved in cytochrome bd biosynthesis fused ATPase/permease subunit
VHITQLVGLASPTAEGLGYGGAIAGLLTVIAAVAADGALTPALAVLTFLLAWAVSAPLVSMADRRWRAHKLADLGSLADDLTRLLEAPSEVTTAEAAAETSPAGRLDLDALPDPLDAEDGLWGSRGRIGL